ncbi:hypothetical protein KEM54_003638 [Ascosphaera aggregata]|nr:hypothetical protein KEM54_003638 [Ascosphaera aggregata]
MDSTSAANISLPQSVHHGYNYAPQDDSTPVANDSKSSDNLRKKQYLERVNNVNVSKSDLNRLVMDYLITAGYPSAAANFAQEAEIDVCSIGGWSFPGAEETVDDRAEIRNLLLMGQVGRAIMNINHVDSMLQLIELIRPLTSSAADITPALDFATQNLAPLAPTNSKFLAQLEQTMCLLIFPRDKLSPELSALLDPELRGVVAKRVNRALLLGPGFDDEFDEENGYEEAFYNGYESWRRFCKLTSLVKLRHYVEQELRASQTPRPSSHNTGNAFRGSSYDGTRSGATGTSSQNDRWRRTRTSNRISRPNNDGADSGTNARGAASSAHAGTRSAATTTTNTGSAPSSNRVRDADDIVIPEEDELGYWPRTAGLSNLEGRQVDGSSLTNLIDELINNTTSTDDVDGLERASFHQEPDSTVTSPADHFSELRRQIYTQELLLNGDLPPESDPAVLTHGVHAHNGDNDVTPISDYSGAIESRNFEMETPMRTEPTPGLELDADYVPLLRNLRE